MATPLTDSINALTTYANEVTGASDTTLSDAVHTLASGYGGGGGCTRTVVVPEQTVTTTSDTDWILLTANASIVDGEEYIVTVNSVEKISTATTYVDIIYISFIDFDWGGTGYAFGTAVSGSGVYFRATTGTYTVKIEKLELTGSGGGGGSSATFITKTITANGTYLASDDSVDGYSQVIVNVSGGGSLNPDPDVYPDAEGSYIPLSPYNPYPSIEGSYIVLSTN